MIPQALPAAETDVEITGIEPATSALRTLRSSQLSYVPKNEVPSNECRKGKH